MRHILADGTNVFLCLCALINGFNCIMVPTGKLTPIQPAEPSPPAPLQPSARRLPAPVYEYNNDHPEPPPLYPAYIPIQYDYIQYLSPNAIYYEPKKLKNPIYSANYEKLKAYDKNGKITDKVLQKYQDYPANLQKKYINYYLTQKRQ